MVTMDIISAKDAKNRFGELLASVKAAPIEIQKHGRTVAVLLSSEEYQRIERMEDQYWLEKALIAKANGLATKEESEALLTEILSENH